MSTTSDIFRGVGVGLGVLTPLVPDGTARTVLDGLARAASLLGDLIDHGIEPGEAIAVWRSAVPDVAAANARIDAMIRERTAKPEGSSER